MITVLETGLVYRNPKPHLRAIHTWHPSLVLAGAGEWVATFDIAQAVEAFDYHTVTCRSTDGGKTWSAPAPLLPAPTPGTTHSVRTSRMSDGTHVAFGAQWHRRQDEGLTNRENLGFLATDLIITQSHDSGRTWAPHRVVTPPLVGPSFEVCHPVVELNDGRWLWPTSTWKGWNGDAPHGMKCVALVSNDRGQTWPTYVDIVDDYQRGIINWEVSMRQMPDGRLVAVTWAFHEPSGRTHPSRYTVSRDGQRFGPPRPTGFLAQTCKILPLGGDRLLCVYRRDDQPGLWGTLADVKGEEWRNVEEACLWRNALAGMTGRGTNSDELCDLRFGYPSLLSLPDGTTLVAFWCREEDVNNIRWIRARVA
jgi:sialidase-1